MLSRRMLNHIELAGCEDFKKVMLEEVDVSEASAFCVVRGIWRLCSSQIGEFRRRKDQEKIRANHIVRKDTAGIPFSRDTKKLFGYHLGGVSSGAYANNQNHQYLHSVTKSAATLLTIVMDEDGDDEESGDWTMDDTSDSLGLTVFETEFVCDAADAAAFVMFFAKNYLWSERDSWGSELVLPDDGGWLQELQELADSEKPGCKMARALLECKRKESCRMVRVMLSYSVDESHQIWQERI